MARLTVEDCLQNIDNRYDLVLIASKRARQLTMGKEPMVESENDKPTVIALREIAAGLVNSENIEKIGKYELDEEEETETLDFPPEEPSF